MYNQCKLLLRVFLFLIMHTLIFAQTLVSPVLELQTPEVLDQDDMCIWLHPTDHSLSTIIASDKTANKLFVYNLSGEVIQTISASGKPGNIDVRYNFSLSGVPVDIVGYNDRTNRTIVLFKVNPSTSNLTEVGNFDALKARLHTLPSPLMTASSSGLSALRRRRRLRIFEPGALRFSWRWARKSRCLVSLAAGS